MAAGEADGGPPNYYGWQGPIPSSVASTDTHPQRTSVIHIVLLGETKLRPRQELWLPNFFVYRRDEVSPRGIAYRCIAVLVRRDVVHGRLELPDFMHTRTLGIRVGSSGSELRLFAVYRPLALTSTLLISTQSSMTTFQQS
ncbi:hypothetical protein EVAR_97505_1 [Eumeta japonica]|uniref:Uncharacterized protein n=1 Tax=Eumeta variegata TaxID=151549 RepID=A0A4C1WPI5_EUMVA|nr:hypothetical protein EVAR_97505_1 [Eumeta japonica]